MTPVARALFAAALLVAVPAARAEEPAAPPPKTESAPAPESKPAAPAPARSPAAPGTWLTDAEAARREARSSNRRILAVVLAGSYESEPSRRLERALDEAPAKAALEGLVPLRVSEGADLAFSKAAGLEDLGHPYTAILEADGRAVGWRRGAFPAEAWAKEARALAAAAAAWDGKRAAVDKAPGDAKALWECSEALRPLGRVREADDLLDRVERADPKDAAGLGPQVRFRRLEARLEDLVSIQDFDGARDLCDAYDREFPASPRRDEVALWRAIGRAFRGEPETARRDLEALAEATKDEALRARIRAKIEALDKVIEKKGAK